MWRAFGGRAAVPSAGLGGAERARMAAQRCTGNAVTKSLDLGDQLCRVGAVFVPALVLMIGERVQDAGPAADPGGGQQVLHVAGAGETAHRVPGEAEFRTIILIPIPWADGARTCHPHLQHERHRPPTARSTRCCWCRRCTRTLRRHTPDWHPVAFRRAQIRSSVALLSSRLTGHPGQLRQQHLQAMIIASTARYIVER